MLEGVSNGETDPPDFRALANQLFPIARMFESLGFMSVSREVAYVENALSQLAPQREESSTAAGSAGPAPTESTSRPSLGDTPLERPPEAAEVEPQPRPIRRFEIPKPVGVMLFVLLLAILGSIFIVRWHDARQPRPTARQLAGPPEPVPHRESPTPSPTPQTVVSPTPSRAQELADLIGQARLAVQEGDLDRAISLVSSAALLDPGGTAVVDTAQSIVNELLVRSDAVAQDGDWEQEQQLIDRARELSVRFGFPTEPIEEAVYRHATIVRFETIRPDDLAAIRAAIGRRVTVYLEGGSTEEGRIRGVSGPSLELDQIKKVGGGVRGGEVRYVEPIHLDLITEIRVYQD